MLSFWDALREIAASRQMSVGKLVEEIAASPWNRGNLSSTPREFLFNEYRSRILGAVTTEGRAA
jgi:predicted DNA-binding ribbon-helix-helix protein